MYPIRGVVQVACLSVVLCLTVPIHLIRVWTGHIRKWRLSSRDLSSEWRKTAEERGGGESRTKDFCAANVAGSVFTEREVVDMMATLLCSFDGMESKIDNGDCFGPEIVSRTHATIRAEDKTHTKIKQRSTLSNKVPALQTSREELVHSSVLEPFTSLQHFTLHGAADVHVFRPLVPVNTFQRRSPKFECQTSKRPRLYDATGLSFISLNFRGSCSLLSLDGSAKHVLLDSVCGVAISMRIRP